MDFPQYLERKYIDWQQEQGQRRTIEDFANYIGVSQAAVSHWMNGKRKPTADSTKLLADIFGPEIYDILGLERPDPRLLYIQRVWDQLPHEAHREILEMAENFYKSNKGGDDDANPPAVPDEPDKPKRVLVDSDR